MRSSRTCNNGLTLIEVVAAVTILGVLLAGLSVLRGRMLRQWKDAQDQQRAVSAVDDLLAGWYAHTDAPAVPANGMLGGTDFRWSLRRETSLPVFESYLATLRVETNLGRELLSVHLVLPEEMR